MKKRFFCKWCGAEVIYEKTHGGRERRTCSAKHRVALWRWKEFGKRERKKKYPRKCAVCPTAVLKRNWRRPLTCSVLCQQIYQNRLKRTKP